MPEPTFDDLLDKMSAISTAVNAFTSESVQQLAFQALLRSFGVEPPLPGDGGTSGAKGRRPRGRKQAAAGQKPADGAEKGAAKKRGPTVVSLVKGLNFRPHGQTAFVDFAAEKDPQNNDERSTVALFWLNRMGDVAAVTPNHIYSCYREVKWKVPPDLPVSLRKTASVKGYFNTSDSQNIRLEVRGENLVLHELPQKAKLA